MTDFEKLNEGLRELGFKIDGDDYVLDRVTYHKIQINGNVYDKPEHHLLKMVYLGEGCEVDDSDCELDGSEFFEFGILDDDGDVGVTICVRNIDEFKEYL